MTDSVIETTVTGLLVTESAEGTIVTETTETHVLETSTGGGSGATALIVQEGDTTVVAAADTVDFAAADFDVTVSPSGEANVALATGHTGSSHAAVQAAAEATAAAALTAHEGASDPHPGYTTSAELTSALAGYQPLDSDLTAIAALTTTPFGRALLALADAAALRAAAGLGTAATQSTAAFDAAGSAAAAQAASQPLDSDLTAIAALSTTAFGRALLELADAAAMRTAAGLGSIATQAASAVSITGGSVTGITDLAVADGGTGASTAAGARTNLDVPSNAEAVLDTIFDAKGDLLAASAADTPTRVAIGADGQRLEADSSAASGLRWVTPAARFGGIYTLGHSYTQLGGGADSASVYPADTFSNFTHRVAAALGIPADEVFLLGRSGAAASSPSDGTNYLYRQGTGFALQHILPSHLYTSQIAPPTYHDNASATPALFVLMYGFNDLFGGSTGSYDWAVHGRTATQDGLRTIISRCRAKALFLYDNAAIAYAGSGSWSNNTQAEYSTRGTTKRNSTSGGTITFTVPATFTGGTVAFCFLGGANGYTLANGAGSSSTSLTVDSRSNFPQSGNFDILIGGTAATVSGGHGTGAGTFTLTAARTWSDNATVVRASSGKVDWSGTATGATGSTTLSGTGRLGLQVALVKRFELTRADAGKTIIATSASLGSNEYCELDSIWIEDPDPPSVVAVNQPFGPFALHTFDTHTATTVDQLNDDLASVVAEFDSDVAVCDVAAQFDAWFGATCDGATGTGTTVSITVTDAAATKIGVGSVLRCELENMRVDAIVSQSGADMTLTVTRNYTGSLFSPGNHTDGQPIRDIRWLRPDLVHPSDFGHRMLTQVVLDAVDAMPQSDTQAANAGGYVVRREAGIRNASYVTTSGCRGLSNAGSFTQYVEYAAPFYLPSLAIATEIGYYVTTQNASGTGRVGRLGIRQDSGSGRPGYLLLDAGQVASDISTTGFKSIAVWQPLKPGWYWFCMIPQGTSGQWSSTVVLAAHKQNTAQNQGIASGYTGMGASAAPSSTNTAIYPPVGMSYSCTATFTGAFDTLWYNLGLTSGATETVLTGNGSGDQAPVIWVKLTAPVRD